MTWSDFIVSRSVGCGALSTIIPSLFSRDRHLVKNGIPLGGKTSRVSPYIKLVAL